MKEPPEPRILATLGTLEDRPVEDGRLIGKPLAAVRERSEHGVAGYDERGHRIHTEEELADIRSVDIRIQESMNHALERSAKVVAEDRGFELPEDNSVRSVWLRRSVRRYERFRLAQARRLSRLRAAGQPERCGGPHAHGKRVLRVRTPTHIEANYAAARHLLTVAGA